MGIEFFEKRFQALGTPARAAGQKAYMKSALRFYGVTQPQIRAAAAEFVREQELDRTQLRALVEAAYASDCFDLRTAALVVMEKRRTLLTRADADWLIALVRRSA